MSRKMSDLKSGFHDTHIDVSIKDPVARIQAYIDSYAKAGGQNVRRPPPPSTKSLTSAQTFDNLLMTQTHLLSSTLKNASEDGMGCFTIFSIPVIPPFCSAMASQFSQSPQLI